MNLIFKALSGSKAYGLDSENSDTDIRGVFITDKIQEIFGLRKRECQKGEGEDELYYEFKHFLNLLRNGNTTAIEMLYTKNPIITCSFWKGLDPKKLIDPNRLFSSLIGYCHGEKRVANGERTGRLGSKRKEAIDKYGFSPKNFVQLLRLCYCGQYFLHYGEFPIDLRDFGTIRSKLLPIKFAPEQFNKDELNNLVDIEMGMLKDSFDKSEIKNQFKFNEEYIDSLLKEVYHSYI
ncbi:MAG: nucleotidyltransferase domain-containing protein [Nanoarchaeota archaeon]